MNKSIDQPINQSITHMPRVRNSRGPKLFKNAIPMTVMWVWCDHFLSHHTLLPSNTVCHTFTTPVLHKSGAGHGNICKGEGCNGVARHSIRGLLALQSSIIIGLHTIWSWIPNRVRVTCIWHIDVFFYLQLRICTILVFICVPVYEA